MSGLEIFKAGTFTDMEGKRHSFSEDDVAATVAAYDPAVFAAPLVVGHPKVEDPAYGWVAGLALADATITATPEKVEPAFAEMVNDGRFPKISASFWPPKHPSNPKPGVWYLRHVGFLGAAAPAVKGLKTASFADDADLVTIEFADGNFNNHWVVSRLARGIRDWLLTKFGAETADLVVPDYLARDAERMADEALPQASFADGGDARTSLHQQPEGHTVDPNKEKDDKTAEFAERETALQTREKQLADREAALAEQESLKRREGVANFAAALVEAGKLLPSEKEGLVAFMEGLDANAVVEFAEGAGVIKKSGEEWFKDFLDKLPARVEFAERGAAGDDQASTAEFAAPTGYSVDPDKLALHQKALAYQATHKCDYTTAVDAVK